MPSFELIYEEEEDVLEVTFEVFDENFARAIALNEEIVLHTDTQIATAWGLTFYSYGQLLQSVETDLDGLQPLDQANRARLFALIARRPVSYFLTLLDTEQLRAQVLAPRLKDLIAP